MFSVVFDPILLILADNEDMNKSLDVFFTELQPLTTEVAALERVKTMSPLFSVDIDPILLKLACNEDMHEISFGQVGPPS